MSTDPLAEWSADFANASSDAELEALARRADELMPERGRQALRPRDCRLSPKKAETCFECGRRQPLWTPPKGFHRDPLWTLVTICAVCGERLKSKDDRCPDCDAPASVESCWRCAECFCAASREAELRDEIARHERQAEEFRRFLDMATPSNVIEFPKERAAVAASADRFAVLAKTAREWAQEKPPPPVVDGLLVGRGVVTFFGPWGRGKTYLALDLGLAVAAGMPDWHGERLYLAGPVCYCATEGEGSLATRLRAWERARGRELPEDFCILPGGLDLASEADRRDSLAWLQGVGPALVVLDTLAAASAGLDENSSGEMGVVLGWAREASRRTGALVLVVHHPPKGDATTARGSGVLEANVDGVVILESSGAEILVRAKKLRSGRPAPPLRFQLQSVDLGPDPERPGRRVQDAVLVRAAEPPEVELWAIVEEVAREASWPVRLNDAAKKMAERRGVSIRQAKRDLEALVPVGERNADTMSGLWRDQASSRQPWLIHKREDSGATDPRGHGGP